MKAPEIFTKTGATPAKLGLAAVLAVSLVVVLIVQFGPGAEENVAAQAGKPSSAEPRKPKATSPPPSQPAQEVRDTKIRQPRVWPDVECEEVAAFNPFVIPESLALHALAEPTGDAETQADEARHCKEEQLRREQRRQRREAILKELKSTGAQLILMSDEGPVAVIGDRRLRIGDIVEGLRVKDITAQGVVLVEIDQ